MSDTNINSKILSDKAIKLLSDISNLYDESGRFHSLNLTSEDCPKSSSLSEENIVFKTHVTWLVKKCQLEGKTSGKYIESSSVEVSSPDIRCLWFRFYPEGKYKTLFQSSFDFCVHFKNLPEKIYIVCDVALICGNNLLKKTFSGNANVIEDKTIEFLDFFANAKVIRNQMAGKSEKDKLMIQCRIKVLSRIYTCVSEKLTYTVKMVPEDSNLNNDLLKSGKYSDVTLLAESKEIKAHKFILASESPNLHVLMKVNPREVLELEGRHHLLEKLLKYMYTGKFRIFSFSDAIDYYITSYKYEVLNLKNLCTTYLIANLTEKNYVAVMDLSRSHEDEYLCNACIAFVKTLSKIDPQPFMKKHY